jgi:NAD+ kinase
MAAAAPLKLIVIAAQPSPRVRDGWRDLEPAVRAEERIKLVAVDDGGGLDFNRRKADLVVVLGGDGAILRACRQMGSKQLPILGVNLGRLGFLADLSPDEFRDNLPGIAARKFHVVEHLMYECELTRSGKPTQRFLGLNEVAVSSAAAMRMIDVHLAVDDEAVTTYSGDGVIVSTPVGSTAHNLSAGGPILRQDLQAFVITPICPHTLTNRPLVDSADCVYTLSLPDIPEGTTLIIDGQIKQPLVSGDVIRIRRASVTFQLARVPQHSYYGTLHRKLGWSGQPNYQRQDRRN